MRIRDLLLFGFIIVLAAAGLLTLHTVRHIIRMHRSTEPLRAWMSIPYIARTHHVPAATLYQAAGLPTDRRDRRPLARIARQQGRKVEALIADIQTAITRARAKEPQHAGRGAP